jgi:hypothetical protein
MNLMDFSKISIDSSKVFSKMILKTHVIMNTLIFLKNRRIKALLLGLKIQRNFLNSSAKSIGFSISTKSFRKNIKPSKASKMSCE